MEITQEVWGVSPEGEAVILYTMTASTGASIKLTNYGAAIVSVIVPDKNGILSDVALGYGCWKDYVSDGPAMGKSVGRYANRIAKGKFTLDDKEYRLAVNNGPNHLHGGPSGFQNRVWDARVETDRVVFSYMSLSGEEGYPGELNVEACYDWDDACNLEITYFAKSDATTVVNLTNHVYFNLKGDGNGTIHDHYLQLSAEKFLPTDSTAIPTGELESVTGTPMDFAEPHLLGERIEQPYIHLQYGKGYDHCWAVDGYKKGKMSPAACLWEPTSGRMVRVTTTQPGIQVYTGNWLAGSPLSKTGVEYVDRSGVALECQAFPDSPNKPQFPSVVLTPDETYEEHIVYSFGVK